MDKLDAWYAAARDFVSAFSSELALLESSEPLSVDTDEYLRGAYTAKHRSAISAFEHFVPAASRPEFKKTIQDYHSGKASQEVVEAGFSANEAMFVEYANGPYAHPNLSGRQLAAVRIRALLAFARDE